jgi:tetratricopeptide (TPR) repeat protein
VVEDLHWADEASLILWHRLTRSAAQLPLLLAASCRPVPVPPGLSRLRGELQDLPGAGLITLGGLSAADVARLAEDLVGRPPGERLTEHLASASGNPLYVRELLDAFGRSGTLREDAGSLDVHLDDRGPANAAVISLSRVIVDRLDSLTTGTRQTLVTAALLGPVFSVGDLAVVAGRAPTELVGTIEEAVAAGVVESEGARLRFRHGLLRQALSESVPLALRVALHQQAVSALIAADASAERVAELLLPVLAEADGWELGWIAEHGGTLMNRAPEVAAELLEHALDRLELDDPRRARVQDALLPLSFYLRRIDRAERIARDILATAAEPERAGRAYWFLTRTDMHHRGKTEEALKTVAEALDGDRLDVLWRARLAALRSICLATMYRKQDAREEAERSLVQGERLRDTVTGGSALHTLSLLSLFEDDLVSATDLAGRALEFMGGDAEVTDLRLLVGANRFAWLADQDRAAEAEEGARQVLALAERSWTPRMGSIRLRVAEMAYVQGRWDDAQAELEQAAEFPIGIQVTAVRHAYQALIAAHRDDWESAAEHFEALDAPEYAVEWVAGVGPVLMARILEAERTGSAERIIETLAPRLAVGAEPGPGWQLLLPDLARAARQHEDEQTLRAVRELCGIPVPKDKSPSRHAGSTWSAGLLAGDPASVLSAAEYFRGAQRLPWLGKSLEDAAVLQAEAGDLTAARSTLAEALEVYAGLGAVWDSRRALARIRPYGVRPCSADARRPAGRR